MNMRLFTKITASYIGALGLTSALMAAPQQDLPPD